MLAVTIAFEYLLGGYLIIGLLLIFGLWLYYDRRDSRYYDRRRRRRCFHCVKCGHLYSSNKAGQKINCTECGFANPPLRF